MSILFTTPSVLAAAGGGSDIFSTISTASSNGKAAATAVGGALAVVFVLYVAWRARGALAGVVSALLVGIFFYWALTHVADSGVQSKISNTFHNGSGVVSTRPHDRDLSA